MKRITFILLFCTLSLIYVNSQSRWEINQSGGITWKIDSRIPHYDHIEMSGEQISVVLRYGVNESRAFVLERSFIWPMLRTLPNNTHASLMRRFGWDVVRNMMIVNTRRVIDETVRSITLNGVMVIESELSVHQNGKLLLKRYLFPSTTEAAYAEKYVLINVGERAVLVEVPDAKSVAKTDAKRGVDGVYNIEANLTGVTGRSIEVGDSVVFYSSFLAYKAGETAFNIDVEKELNKRKNLVSEFQNNLVLESPDEVINTMFSFAKIRGSESIYKTKGGYMHGPGGESYYAAIWANDQAEYINPFFPFLGYKKGNMSAYNSYKHFARFMNDEFEAIPSSIIAEGLDIWNGAGDRGDGAMIAYGVARYALARGNKQEAIDLWPLLEWCLEYCRRNLNEDGVVTSDSDELENRFPSGDANLTTSSLYYDALISAAYLGKELGKPSSQIAQYNKQAKELRKNIESYFGGTVEGINTYKYYKGNDLLRSWICIPLTVGIYDRKDATIEALFSPHLWTENGLLTQSGSETFWDRSTLYALRGVLASGETEKGIEYLKFYSKQRLLGEHVPYAIEAWPEGSQRHLSAESGLYCRIITEGLFGIRPVGLRSFTLKPNLPEGWDNMSLKRIKAFGSDFDLNIKRSGKKIRVEVIVDNKIVLDKLENVGTETLINLPKR
ncbi:MAG: hypothetical protein ACOX14_05945 [Fermentimonas caenicola]|jgi:hypothetical protein|uniref:hypothetical protein n=1 Tax=Lascolabacillus sp. TaxID=1924068 RepID=UPI0025873928|nr:hypothetical protein [Lascolabacillus sp.]MDD3657996.1 hypothetical protein [Lascolabacillus sp.]MDI9625647.1 hypothetical protein [Bacteroidota bacterium]